MLVRKMLPVVANDAHVVLDVQGELKIVAPVAAVVAVVRQDRVVEEDPQAVEVGAQAVEHDDVGRDDEEVARERRVRLVELVEEAPGDEQREHLRLAGAGRHLQRRSAASPRRTCRRTPRRKRRSAAGRTCPARAAHVVEPDEGLDRFALGEVVAERRQRAVGLLDEVRRSRTTSASRLDRGRGRAGVAAVAATP